MGLRFDEDEDGRGTCSNCTYYDPDIGDCGFGTMPDPEDPYSTSCDNWKRSSYR